jgi:predicted nucleotidyltransferase
MTFAETRELAVKVIREEFAAAGILIRQILLFGSQARNTAGEKSDWDFLVCVHEELAFPEKAIIITKIQTRLAEKFISADVIIKSEARIARERGNVGVITYYALKDGVPV